GSTVQWIDLSADPPVVTVTPNTASLGSRIKVRGHRLVGIIDGNIGFTEFGSSDVEVVNATVYHGSIVQDILAYDGNVAYLSSNIPGDGVTIGSAALQAIKRGVPADQALVTEVRMQSVPTSLIAIDGGLAVGSANQ